MDDDDEKKNEDENQPDEYYLYPGDCDVCKGKDKEIISCQDCYQHSVCWDCLNTPVKDMNYKLYEEYLKKCPDCDKLYCRDCISSPKCRCYYDGEEKNKWFVFVCYKCVDKVERCTQSLIDCRGMLSAMDTCKNYVCCKCRVKCEHCESIGCGFHFRSAKRFANLCFDCYARLNFWFKKRSPYFLSKKVDKKKFVDINISFDIE